MIYLDKMEPASLSMDYWKSVNARGGDFRLSFAGIKVGWKFSGRHFSESLILPLSISVWVWNIFTGYDFSVENQWKHKEMTFWLIALYGVELIFRSGLFFESCRISHSPPDLFNVHIWPKKLKLFLFLGWTSEMVCQLKNLEGIHHVIENCQWFFYNNDCS